MKIIPYLLFMVSIQEIWGQEPIVIGSKRFSESYILGEIAAQLLEKKFGQSVERKFGLGGTSVAFNALDNGAIHVYPEYTGTGYIMILNMDGERDPEKVFQIVSRSFKDRWDIVWSEPIGFNNTYTLAVRGGDDRFNGIDSISDLSGRVSDYKYAADYEFMERQDGHAEFIGKYNLNFQSTNVISMEAGLMYSAIRDERVDMIVAYSTDGRIKAYDLRLLKDDRNFFPPYFVSLLAKTDTLEKFPALRDVFGLMENMITEEEMVEMNDKADRLKIDPAVVAREYLANKGLIEAEAGSIETNLNLYEFFIQKRRELLEFITEHLILSFGALLLATLFSLPMGILLTRYQSLGKVVFPAINTIQTVPSIALLGLLIPLMGIGFPPALLALFLYSLLPLIRNTYVGVLGVDRNYVEVSKGIGLTGTQILLRVEMPLALPVILAGVRTAAVIAIGTATLSALIGAGGLGDPIFRGIATLNTHLIFLGAIPAAFLAIIVDRGIGYCERLLVSKGLRLMRRSYTGS